MEHDVYQNVAALYAGVRNPYPEGHVLHRGLAYDSVDFWNCSLSSDSDQEFVEANLQPFWRRYNAKIGNTVVSLGNQSGGMSTGQQGVIVGFYVERREQVRILISQAYSKLTFERQNEIFNVYDKICGISSSEGKFMAFPQVRNLNDVILLFSNFIEMLLC